MLLRRDLLRIAAIGGLALPMLAACGSDGSTPVSRGDVALATADVRRAVGDPAASAGAAAAIAGLGGSLYGPLGEQPGNVAFSPYSVAVALAMTANGAAGTTADEMLAVLGVEDLEQFNAGLNALTQALEGLTGTREVNGEEVELAFASANSLWGQVAVPWGDAFLATLARDYGTGMQQVDYVAATEAARVAINDWTAERTRDKITEILPEGSIDALTRLVLVNAVYLKAPWLQPFTGDTTDAPFVLRDGTTVDVPMMRDGSATFRGATGEGWSSVRLPYADPALAMTVVLPDEGRLGEVEDVVARDLATFVEPGLPQQFKVELPRFTFRFQAGLAPILASLGMRSAFDAGSADFSGMTEQEELFITAVLHEAFIAVDEEGTEAAAATAAVMGVTSVPVDPPETLVVDRPFLFVIHDTDVGTPLFVGRVDDPRG